MLVRSKTYTHRYEITGRLIAPASSVNILEIRDSIVEGLTMISPGRRRCVEPQSQPRTDPRMLHDSGEIRPLAIMSRAKQCSRTVDSAPLELVRRTSDIIVVWNSAGGRKRLS